MDKTPGSASPFAALASGVRSRDRILDDLERAYREAYSAAEAAGDSAGMARLDLDFQRDQLRLEALLDTRDLLVLDEDESKEPESMEAKARKLLERARSLRALTRLR